jgi:NAD(P)-dependent dehydrogenase (short-subunit alcohol dehydrogenase family)
MPRTVVITGASSGVGLAAAVQFAARGDQVVVVGRDPGRLGAAMAQIRAAATGPEPDEHRADFESLDQVRELGEKVLSAYPRIDVLANNAGGMVGSYVRTADGFEATVQGNHLAPFLLTHVLRDALRGGRVVNTASQAHRRARVSLDFTQKAEDYSSWRAYGAAKAANILFASEAARRWPDITSVSFHPGVVRSNFGAGTATRFFWKYAPFLTTPEKAGELLVWLADAEVTDGAYYVGHKVTVPDKTADDDKLAAQLWEASSAAVGVREQ